MMELKVSPSPSECRSAVSACPLFHPSAVSLSCEEHRSRNLHFRRQLLLLPRTLFFLHFRPPVPLLDSPRHRFATSFLVGLRPCSATTRRRFWARLLPSPSRHWCLAGATSVTAAASARAFSAARPRCWPRSSLHRRATIGLPVLPLPLLPSPVLPLTLFQSCCLH
ncbi:hypothetical protein VIGAN_04143300 [Vigna angularis var. angularis]|uniref:Uncharacterized protein n=1 Tax=Vigna angularis var. angularis TaxID=157739 RepID=A0A0S3RU53_PHAAN|nr:hypothetical protein VIGAN_04143300 [Vigna angularis var. angularis]